jgi:hypothetical protein
MKEIIAILCYLAALAALGMAVWNFNSGDSDLVDEGLFLFLPLAIACFAGGVLASRGTRG